MAISRDSSFRCRFFYFRTHFFDFGIVFRSYTPNVEKNQLATLKENFMLDIKKNLKIPKNKKARPNLKIFGRASSIHLISFGTPKVTHCKQKNLLEQGKKVRRIPEEITNWEPIQKNPYFVIWFNSRKNQANTSKGNDLRADPKEPLFRYKVSNDKVNFLINLPT